MNYSSQRTVIRKWISTVLDFPGLLTYTDFRMVIGVKNQNHSLILAMYLDYSGYMN